MSADRPLLVDLLLDLAVLVTAAIALGLIASFLGLLGWLLG